MKNRIWIVLLLVSLGINIGFLLHWFWPKRSVGLPALSDHAHAGWHASPMSRGLGLNPQQVQLMENERRQVMAQAKPLQDDLRRRRRELFLLFKNRQPAEADLDLALSEISRLQIAIEKLFILHTSKMKGFFTPQQLQKYEVFFEQGLCPGMMSEKACPPGLGDMRGRKQSGPDCDVPCAEKK